MADKLREGEATATTARGWLIRDSCPIAKEVFDAHMPAAKTSSPSVLREDVSVSPEDLLRVPEGQHTDDGLRHNVRVGVQYLEAWLRGNGCVPLYNLMEDAATAEISRAQVWQWLPATRQALDGMAARR